MKQIRKGWDPNIAILATGQVLQGPLRSDHRRKEMISKDAAREKSYIVHVLVRYLSASTEVAQSQESLSGEITAVALQDPVRYKITTRYKKLDLKSHISNSDH